MYLLNKIFDTNIANSVTTDQFICAIQLIKNGEKKYIKFKNFFYKIFNKLPQEPSPIARAFFLEMPF